MSVIGTKTIHVKIQSLDFADKQITPKPFFEIVAEE